MLVYFGGLKFHEKKKSGSGGYARRISKYISRDKKYSEIAKIYVLDCKYCCVSRAHPRR